jgi:hypothetical protein
MTESENKEFPIRQQALEIAKKNLRNLYAEHGIRAGSGLQSDYWSRDGFLAILGALSLGEEQDIEAARRHLDLFANFQSEEGAIPLRIEDQHREIRALTGIKIKKPLEPRFRAKQIKAHDAVDPTLLYIIAVISYAETTGDAGWLSGKAESLTGAVDWIMSKKNGLGLIEEGFKGGWADQGLRNGAVTLTNVMAYEAFRRLGLNDQASKLKEVINAKLWLKDGGHYADHINKNGRMNEGFPADANLMAINFGVSDSGQSVQILSLIDRNNMHRIPVATRPNPDPYMGRFERIYTNFLFPHYHPDNIFGWWGPQLVVSRLKVGDIEGAERDLDKLSEVIVKNRSTFEVVNPNGDMVDHWFYKSERGPAWAAGMFIYAANSLKKEL